MRMMAVIQAVAAVLLGLACAGDAPDSRITLDLSGFAQAGCGPADGPAVEIYLASGGLRDGDPRILLDSLARVGMQALPSTTAPAAAERVLRVVLWDSANRARGHRFVLRSGENERGEAAICTAGSGCVPVAQAEFRFDASGEPDLSGEYELTRAGDPAETGRFRARWVERAVMCG